MRSIIHCHCPSLLPHHSQLKHKQKLKTNNYRLLWLRSGQPSRLVNYGQNQSITSTVPLLRTNAIHNSIILGVTPPAKSGDVSVLLQTGFLMFCVYFFANFIVPDLISKYFKFDELNEDQNSDK